MIKDLVLKNKDIFWLEGDSLGSCNVDQHEINLTDDKTRVRKAISFTP